VLKTKQKPAFDADAFLRFAGTGKTLKTYQPTDVIFSQGDAADSVLYIQKGAVKLAVLSPSGKEAVVAMLGPGDFLGEQALAGHSLRLTAAISLSATTALVVPKQQMIRLLHENHAFSDRFIAHMLARNIRIEEDLVDQLFNSSEKRLARALLMLARYGKLDADASYVAADLSGDVGGNDRHDALARKLLYEQVQEARLHRIQRRPQGKSFAADGRRARLNVRGGRSRHPIDARPPHTRLLSLC
jgi:CRP/FNR family cyclic AMP-dependent transcriptional regulator